MSLNCIKIHWMFAHTPLHLQKTKCFLFYKFQTSPNKIEGVCKLFNVNNPQARSILN